MDLLRPFCARHGARSWGWDSGLWALVGMESWWAGKVQVCAGDLREILRVPLRSQGYCGVGPPDPTDSTRGGRYRFLLAGCPGWALGLQQCRTLLATLSALCTRPVRGQLLLLPSVSSFLLLLEPLAPSLQLHHSPIKDRFPGDSPSHCWIPRLESLM